MEEETISSWNELKSLILPFTTSKAILIIIIVGLCAYFNSLFNNFVFDDLGQIVNNLSIHSISSIPNILINQNISQLSSNYYRPIPIIFYTILYSLFQQITFPYHLAQLLFHISNTILLFLILNKFIKQKLSFFLSLIFLVHPINQETVVYIANLPDVLFVFFGLYSFYLLHKESNNLKNLYSVYILLLLSLLSKETGILFVFINIIYVLIYQKRKILTHLYFSIPVILVYIFLRLISQVSFQKESLIPIMNLSLPQRLQNIPAIVFYYIKILVFPKDLVALHSWVITRINFENFYLPLIIDLLFFLLLISISFFFYRRVKDNKLILLFLTWFILGVGIHLQIVPIDMTVADRYFYLPFVGLLSLTGIFIENLKFNKKYLILPVTIGIILVTLYSVRDIIRNSDWQNQSNILSHDEPLTNNDYLQEVLYGGDLFNKGKYQDAIYHTQKAIELFPQSAKAWNTLGAIYYKQGDVEPARNAFEKAISVNRYYASYENLALLELQHDDIYKAKVFIKNSNSLYPNSSTLWFYRIIVETKTNNHDDALNAARNYYLLKGDQQSLAIYSRLLNNQPVNINLK